MVIIEVRVEEGGKRSRRILGGGGIKFVVVVEDGDVGIIVVVVSVASESDDIGNLSEEVDGGKGASLSIASKNKFNHLGKVDSILYHPNLTSVSPFETTS